MDRSHYVGEGPILPAALARHSSSSCIQSSGVLPKLKLQPSYIHMFLPTLTADSNLFPIRAMEMRRLSVSECLNVALKLSSLGVIYQQPGRKKSLLPQTRVSNCTVINRIRVYRTNCATARTVFYISCCLRSDTFINNSPSKQKEKIPRMK